MLNTPLTDYIKSVMEKYRCTSLCTPYFIQQKGTHILFGGDIVHYTHLEDYIFKLYKSLSIERPDQLIKEDIARKLKLEICYRNNGVRFNNSITLAKSSNQKEWQMFGHELCHCLHHVGNQLSMHYLFRDLQEYQADYFSYHFCVPTFMINYFKEVTVYDVMNYFNVEFDFALRRLEMYYNKILLRSDYLEGSRS